MPALALVAHLEAFEQGSCELDSGIPSLAIEELDLDTSPERLREGVDRQINSQDTDGQSQQESDRDPPAPSSASPAPVSPGIMLTVIAVANRAHGGREIDVDHPVRACPRGELRPLDASEKGGWPPG